jgi:hypothetical protein
MGKPVPPASHCLVADLDATLVVQILDVSWRQRKRMQSIPASWMISSLVLTSLKGERLVIRRGSPGALPG